MSGFFLPQTTPSVSRPARSLLVDKTGGSGAGLSPQRFALAQFEEAARRGTGTLKLASRVEVSRGPSNRPRHSSDCAVLSSLALRLI